MTEFLSVFTMKRDHCRELLALSRGQESLIAADAHDELLDVLHRKQTVLVQLDALSARSAETIERWPHEREALPAADRADCDAILAEIDQLVAELLRNEQSDLSALIGRRDRTRRELRTVSTGSHVNDAYRDSLAPSSHRHLDIDT